METKFIKRIDLRRDGVSVEVTLLKAVEVDKDENGNPLYELWYIQNDQLDAIDQKRLLNILQKSARVKDFQPLYETMAQVTLGNGVNALDYFHQYVRVLYPSGAIMRPKLGRSGGVAPLASDFA